MADRKELGLAIVGCGVVGRMRGALARDFPGIGWIGLSDMNERVGQRLKEDIGADYFTTDFKELIARPEVDAAIIATSTWGARRTHARRSEARPSHADRKAARHGRARVGIGACGDRIGRRGRRRRLHPAFPQAVSGCQGSRRERPDRRRHRGGHARLHEPHGADGRSPPFRGPPLPDAHGRLRHPQSRHVPVADGRRQAGPPSSRAPPKGY